MCKSYSPTSRLQLNKFIVFRIKIRYERYDRYLFLSANQAIAVIEGITWKPTGSRNQTVKKRNGNIHFRKNSSLENSKINFFIAGTYQVSTAYRLFHSVKMHQKAFFFWGGGVLILHSRLIFHRNNPLTY